MARDGGYVVGAVLVGIVADLSGAAAAVWTVAALTFVSGIIVLIGMRSTVGRRPGGER